MGGRPTEILVFSKEISKVVKKGMNMLCVSQICHPGKFVIRRFFLPMITRIQINIEMLPKVGGSVG